MDTDLNMMPLVLRSCLVEVITRTEMEVIAGVGQWWSTRAPPIDMTTFRLASAGIRSVESRFRSKSEFSQPTVG